VLLDSVIGGRIFDTLERKFSRTFPRRILRVFSTESKFGLTSASIAGSVCLIMYIKYDTIQNSIN
jgi:hypothetical protein